MFATHVFCRVSWLTAMAASGKDAQTVYRNREGRRIDREEWVEQQQKKKKKRAADYPEQDGCSKRFLRDFL